MDPIETFVYTVGAAIAVTVLGTLAYIFISVIFLGGSTSCPQNLC
jgi:hypothetical protein